MNSSSLDQAVIQTMNELMRASSDCAEFDPAMSAKFATAAKDLGRDLGVTLVKPDTSDAGTGADQNQRHDDDDDDETRELLHLLDLQKRAITETDIEMPQRNRLSWLGLDAWSRW